METELVFPVTHPRPAPNGAVPMRNGAVPSPALPDLAAALHRASLAAAAILASPSPSPSAAAIAALRDAHGAIGSFLALVDPSPPLSPTSLGGGGGGGGGDEPMDGEEEVEEGEEVLRGVEEVEEGMRECVLQSKRRKRHASPSWPLGGGGERAAEEEGEKEVSFVRPADRFPRRLSIDLVFQFHA